MQIETPPDHLQIYWMPSELSTGFWEICSVLPRAKFGLELKTRDWVSEHRPTQCKEVCTSVSADFPTWPSQDTTVRVKHGDYTWISLDWSGCSCAIHIFGSVHVIAHVGGQSCGHFGWCKLCFVSHPCMYLWYCGFAQCYMSSCS